MDLLAYILKNLLNLYMLVVILNVILSWVVFGTRNSVIIEIYKVSSQLVDPLLQPIRSVINPITRNIGIDFSPIVLIVLLNILESWL
ncbi:YggT family protein [Candidatus Poribacteria bacterium]|nr:YggT family protein [Candidatus Poribacteria bacterium]